MYRIGQEEIDAVARVIRSGALFKVNDAGREVYNFEEEWKDLTGSQNAITMTSGFAALACALAGAGIGPGDEVIVPGYTYIATALAVTSVGAVPVVCDIDDTLTIDAKAAEGKITPHTKAIIPVHIQGFPCNMDAITDLAKRHHLIVVEDACQADGGEYKGKYLGTIGDAGAYSFNYFKIITAGEGGLMVTDNRKIYERAMIYHDSAAIAFFGHQLDDLKEPVFGSMEYRVSEITGAILRQQLIKLPGILRDLRSNKKKLAEMIAGKLNITPSNDPEGDCGTTLSLKFDTARQCRDFAERCRNEGLEITIPIDTGKHIFTNWTQILQNRCGHHPAMNTFDLPENKGLQTRCSEDTCPDTLKHLSENAYVWVNPDWTDDEIASVAKALLKACR